MCPPPPNNLPPCPPKHGPLNNVPPPSQIIYPHAPQNINNVPPFPIGLGDLESSPQVSPSVKLQVNFCSMTQANTSTGWKRDVRCGLAGAGHAPSSGSWEWQDEHGQWNTYAPAVQRLLGACRSCDVEEWQLEMVGRRYKVEVGAGPGGRSLQTNLDTGVERKVRFSEGVESAAQTSEG